jgi:hypothetical protein
VRDLLRDFERDGHEVYNSPHTNLGAALAVLNHLEDSQQSGTSKPMSALQPLRLKKEVLDTADPRQVPIPEANQSVLDSDVEARVLLTRWLKKGEVKTK